MKSRHQLSAVHVTEGVSENIMYALGNQLEIYILLQAEWKSILFSTP